MRTFFAIIVSTLLAAMPVSANDEPTALTDSLIQSLTAEDKDKTAFVDGALSLVGPGVYRFLLGRNARKLSKSDLSAFETGARSFFRSKFSEIFDAADINSVRITESLEMGGSLGMMVSLAYTTQSDRTGDCRIRFRKLNDNWTVTHLICDDVDFVARYRYAVEDALTASNGDVSAALAALTDQ